MGARAGYFLSVWNHSEIIRPVSLQFTTIDRDLRAQQAFLGIDALPETGLHPLIAAAFDAEPYGALREVRYPTPKAQRPSQSQRDRCDLVLTPDRSQRVYDPVVATRELAGASGTLFEETATLAQPGRGEVEPSRALWIEIKAVAQHRYVDGVPGPNSGYAHELLSGPRGDVVKLASDPLIRHAAVLVVLFTEERESGAHDLSVALGEMIDQDLPVSMPEIESVNICNHAGNAWCTLGLIPLRL